MSVELESAARLNALKQGIEAKTGETYPDLTGGVNALIAGYGQGGGGDDVVRSIVNRSITEFSDSEITTIGDSSFYDCLSLTEVDCPNVRTIGRYAFQIHVSINNTTPLTVNLPLVTNIGESTFEKRKGMTTGNWPLVTSLGVRAFVSCEALKELYFPKLVATQATSCFLNCYGLTVISRLAFPVMKDLWVSFFEACENLTRAEFDVIQNVYQNAFRSCSNFNTLVLRYNGVAVLKNKNCFEGTPIASGTGYIYVPSAHIDGYKLATNWSVYADQFRALEDYTVDGTVDGDLDESKI